MTERRPRVLFISKPIAPPWHDGSKNLVRDLAVHLTRAEPTVLTVSGARAIGPRVRMDAVYRNPGGFAPGASANARVMLRLLTGDAHDIWHFVFAPHSKSGVAARAAKWVRRATGWKGRVIHTIASTPRSFERVNRWMFGDVVVALSDWTKRRLERAGVSAVRHIPPCALAPRVVGQDECNRVRARYEFAGSPVVLYPGDIETSRGAEMVGRAVPIVLRAIPNACIAFACRAKTIRAESATQALRASLASWGKSVRFLGEVEDMPALLATSNVIAFPVDDLYGKVDLPLVLLEGLAAGVPMVLARGGPLEDITSGAFVDPADHEALALSLIQLLQEPRRRDDHIARGKALYSASFDPAVVAEAYEVLYRELVPIQ